MQPRTQTFWDRLIPDSAAVPLPLDAERFRIAQQRVFISSTMDDELTPYRQAARSYEQFGIGVSVMWETIGPQDAAPARGVHRRAGPFGAFRADARRELRSR